MEWVITIALVISFAFWRVPAFLWFSLMASYFIILGLYGSIGWFTLSLAWIFLLAGTIIFCVPPIRQKLITAKLYKILKHVLPPMSNTEREALDAGDVWWPAELFSGNPAWRQFLKSPPSTLTQEEDAFLNHQVKYFCSMIDDWDIVHNKKDLPQQAWDYLKSENFFGMIIPKEYGGLGFSAYAHSTVITMIASRSISAAVTVMVPNSIGPAELLLHYGTDEQKSYYLPRLARGDEMPCFALTAAEAGSDATAMKDYGIVCRGQYGGKEIIGIKLSWNKRYITLAPIATVLGLAFKLIDPDHLIGNETNIGISLALIPTNHPNIEIGRRHLPMGMAFLNGPTTGKDVFIPLDFLIGGKKMAGFGWRMMMECLSAGRGISLPALCTAGSKLASATTSAYASIREQFNISIGQFEGVQEALARIAGFTYMIDAARTITANAIDQGIKPSIASAIIKYYSTELNRQILNDAMDVHAGRGIQLGPNNYLAHTFIATPIGITVEGANILTRNLMIFGQGAIRCHPLIRQEMAALNHNDPEKGFPIFDKLFFHHTGYFIHHIVRSLMIGITGGRFLWLRGITSMRYYYQQLTRLSTTLALISDCSMILLGGRLKRKERLSARLADVLSHLYLGSCLLKHFHNRGERHDEKAFVEWGMMYCLYHCQQALDDFLRNFPKRNIARILRFLTFPFGKTYRRPSDDIEKEMMEHFLKPTQTRQTLIEYCFIGTSDISVVAELEQAFKQQFQIKPIEDKIKAAIHHGHLASYLDEETLYQLAVTQAILTEDEALQLKQFNELRSKLLAVDEFPAHYFENINKTAEATINSG